MCGIIGYIGKQQAVPILLEGLKRLEYRGYDSAGLATLQIAPDLRAHLSTLRTVGKVAALAAVAQKRPVDGGTIGIAHTRWATHGEPSERNTHPHLSRNGRVAVVHNGIIENYEHLRQQLRNEGFRFCSDTDTEVLAHLIERELLRGPTEKLEEAVAFALDYVEGAYAIAVVSAGNEDRLVAACRSSPLIVGIGKDELYVASDVLALAGKVEHVVHVDDGEVVTLRRNGRYTFEGTSLTDVGSRLERPALAESVTKGGYAHYMLKEIHEQPQAMRNVLAGRLRDGYPVTFGGLTPDIESRLRDARRIVLVGCGTSLFAAMAGKSLIERWAGVLCEVEQAAEFAYGDPILSSQDAVIGISQSGETADTLKAMAVAKDRHALCLSITNRVGSALAKRTKLGIYLHAGPEVAVASTKAFTSQVTALAMLALRIAELRERPVPTSTRAFVLLLPHLLQDSLKREGEMQAWAERHATAKRLIIIGRGFGLPLALEGALKVREVAYLDAHGLSAAELKHGTLALVEPGVPVVALLPNDATRAKMLSSVEEVKARGGEVLALEMPDGICEELAPVVLAPLVQLLAYYLGVARGVDVDQPRNLAKAVTVE